ncbi:MAG: hypothetical protein U0836_20410 [Pirellulales bacterium]
MIDKSDNEWWEGVDRQEYLAALAKLPQAEDAVPGPIDYASLAAVSAGVMALLLDPQRTLAALGLGFVVWRSFEFAKWATQRLGRPRAGGQGSP